MSVDGLVKIFFQSEGNLFVLLTVSFALQKLLSFRRSDLFTVSLIVCVTGVLPRKWSLVPMSCRNREINISTKGAILGFVRDLILEGVPGPRRDPQIVPWAAEERVHELAWSHNHTDEYITIEPSSGDEWR